MVVLYVEGGGLGVLLRLLLAATRVPRAVSFVCEMVSGLCVCMVMVHSIGDGGAGGSIARCGIAITLHVVRFFTATLMMIVDQSRHPWQLQQPRCGTESASFHETKHLFFVEDQVSVGTRREEAFAASSEMR